MSETFDAFISYKWCERDDAVRAMASVLQEEGFTVWLDVKQMAGSIERAMHTGVDNSKAVVIFFSEPYKRSINCGKEANRTHETRKPYILVRMIEGAQLGGLPKENEKTNYINLETLFGYEAQKDIIEYHDKTEFWVVVQQIVHQLQTILHLPLKAPRAKPLAKVLPRMLPSYFTRDAVEAALLGQIQSLCKSEVFDHACLEPPTGCIKSPAECCESNLRHFACAVIGFAGVGKSTLLSEILNQPKNECFLAKDCGIHAILWMDCLQFCSQYRDCKRKVDNMMSDDFYNQLLDGLEATNMFDVKELVICRSKPQQKMSIEIGRLIDKKMLNQNSRLLLILDDAWNVDILGWIKALGSCKLRCVLTTRDWDKLLAAADDANIKDVFIKDEKQKVFSVGFLETEKVKEILQSSAPALKSHAGLAANLSERCFGLPLIVSLVTAHFLDLKGEREIAQQYNDIMEDLEEPKRRGELDVDAIECTLSRLLQRTLRLEADANLVKQYYGFQLFDSGTSIDLSDLAIVWRCKDDEAIKTCEKLCRKNLLQEKNILNNHHKAFAIHELLHNACLDFAMRVGTLGKNVNSICAALISAVVLKDAVDRRRERLLLNLLDRCDTRALADLCAEQVYPNKANFFLYLYFTRDWVLYPKTAPTDVAARLLENFIEKLTNEITEKDIERCLALVADNGDSILLTAAKSKNKAKALGDTYQIQVLNNKLLNNKSYQKGLLDAERQNRWISAKLEAAGNSAVLAAFDGNRSALEHMDLMSLNQPYGKQGLTVLMVAAGNGRLGVVDLLLNKGVNLNALSSQKWTALMFAAENGSNEIVLRLLAKGAMLKPNILQLAVRGGQLETVKSILQATLQIFSGVQEDIFTFVNAKGLEDLTALEEAGRTASREMVEVLLKYGAGTDTDIVICAMRWAIRSGSMEIVEELAKPVERINPIERMDYFSDLLCDACMSGQLKIAKLLHRRIQSSSEYQNCIKRRKPLQFTLRMMTALIFHCEHNDQENVTFLVEVCNILPDGDTYELLDTENGRRPIFIAAQKGYFNLVKYLADRCQVKVNIADSKGWTPLMLAAEDGYLKVVRYLLEECDSDITARNVDGRTAIFYASQNGHFAVVKYLITRSQCSVVLDLPDSSGTSPLIMAVQTGREEIVDLLISAGAEVDRVNGSGLTALMLAAAGDHLAIVDYLVSTRNASMHIKSHAGLTAMDMAGLQNHDRIVEHLQKEYGAVFSPDALFAAISHKKLDWLTKLLDLCFDPNARDPKTGTKTALLHAAAKCANMDVEASQIVSVLLGHGASMYDEIVEADEQMPVVVMCLMLGNTDCAKIFFQLGIDLNRLTSVGKTCLNVAIIFGASVESIRTLVAHGADPNGRNNIPNDDENGDDTALHTAVKFDSLAIARYLIEEAKCDKLAKTRTYNWNALQQAAAQTNVGMVELLLANGCPDWCPWSPDRKAENVIMAARFAYSSILKKKKNKYK